MCLMHACPTHLSCHPFRHCIPLCMPSVHSSVLLEDCSEAADAAVQQAMHITDHEYWPWRHHTPLPPHMNLAFSYSRLCRSMDTTLSPAPPQRRHGMAFYKRSDWWDLVMACWSAQAHSMITEVAESQAMCILLQPAHVAYNPPTHLLPPRSSCWSLPPSPLRLRATPCKPAGSTGRTARTSHQRAVHLGSPKCC